VAASAVRRGHPWVFREGVARAPRELSTGDSIPLVDEHGEPLGAALWDAASPIAARVFDRAPATRVDVASILRRFEAALARRAELFPDGSGTTAFRVCNGEGDRLPGLVVDRYADVGVVRLDGAILDPWLDRLAGPLADALARRGVRTLAVRVAAEDGASKLRVLRGPEPPDRVVVLESGMRMEVDLARGQKTGAFLDQRDNRARVRALAKGRARVLNLFSYAGGFSVAAALGGARHVTSVDVAAAAHATAQRTFRENGLDPSAHAFVAADAFVFLDKARARGERFDVVVSDPPSFAPSERALPRALAAYRKLHAQVAAVLAEGGVLCAASCSSHVDMDDFLSTLDDAALGRDDLRVRATHGPPEDHPSLPAWPEGRYLKLVVLW
jgi:23S rRNA (cytosine1962-C5)-methyltransferase